MTNAYRVGGMHCAGCANAVKRAIHRLDPAAQVAVDVAKGEVRIVGAVTRDAASRAIVEAGFTVDATAR
jgi:copper chaperone